MTVRKREIPTPRPVRFERPQRPLFSLSIFGNEKRLDKDLQEIGVTGFETNLECIERNQRMVGRMLKINPTAFDVQQLEKCHADRVCLATELCPAACHHASRLERAKHMLLLTPFLSSNDQPVFFITVVRDKWRKEVGHLFESKPATLHAWMTRRLDTLRSVKGIMAVDVSLEKRGDDVYWQPHLHAVVTGTSAKELKKALKLEPTETTRFPTKIEERNHSDVGMSVGYVIKRKLFSRTKKEGQKKIYKGSLEKPYQIEADNWLLGQTTNQRIQLIGLSINNGCLVEM